MAMELSSAKYFEETPEMEQDHHIRLDESKWTIGLTVICIVSILFGVWGLGSSALGLSNVLTKPDRKAALEAAAQHGYHARQIQEKTFEIEKKFFTPRLFFYIVKFGLSVALLCGSLFLIMKLPYAKSFAVTTFGSAIAFHVAGALLSCLMFVSLSGTIETASRAAVSSQVGYVHDSEMDDVMSQYMGAVSLGALIVTLVGLLLKGGVYAGMIFYMHTPLVRLVFGENPYPEYDEMKAKADAGLDVSLC